MTPPPGSVKHVTTIEASEKNPAGRWVIALEPRRGRFFEVNVPQDIKPEELDDLFVEAQATIADRQAAKADAHADTVPSGPPPVKG